MDTPTSPSINCVADKGVSMSPLPRACNHYVETHLLPRTLFSAAPPRPFLRNKRMRELRLTHAL